MVDVVSKKIIVLGGIGSLGLIVILLSMISSSLIQDPFDVSTWSKDRQDYFYQYSDWKKIQYGESYSCPMYMGVDTIGGYYRCYSQTLEEACKQWGLECIVEYGDQ